MLLVARNQKNNLNQFTEIKRNKMKEKHTHGASHISVTSKINYSLDPGTTKMRPDYLLGWLRFPQLRCFRWSSSASRRLSIQLRTFDLRNCGSRMKPAPSLSLSLSQIIHRAALNRYFFSFPFIIIIRNSKLELLIHLSNSKPI